MSNKVALTGHFTLLDGTPAEGTVLIRPSRSPILDLEGKQVIAGPQRFQLDAEGRFSVDLPPTDDPALGEPFTYHVMVSMHHTNWQVIGLTLPADAVSVDVLDPPAGVVKEYPTRAEWDAITGAAVSEMETALAGAESARDTTVSARDTAMVARDETLTARDVTFTARDTAVGAASEAVTARDETLPARDETLAARDETAEARDETFIARTETITTAGEVEEALAGKVTGGGMTLRHDTTVGERVFLDHPGGSTMLYGDTGWRDITGLLTPGLTKSSSPNAGIGAAIRRIGNTVTLEVFVDIHQPGITVIVPIPPNFRPLQQTFRSGNLLTSTSSGAPLPATPTTAYVSHLALASTPLPEGGTAQYSGTWVTPSPWPTTHTGTPASN